MTEDPTQSDVSVERRSGRSWRPQSWAVLAVGASVMLVLLSPLLDHDRVENISDQRDVALGLPLAWLHQDQGALDPPLPGQAGFASPWEHPTTVSSGPLILDVVIVFVVLMVALGFVLATTRRSTSGCITFLGLTPRGPRASGSAGLGAPEFVVRMVEDRPVSGVEMSS